jgi:phytoene dehydrogenase-like protein
MSISFLFKMLPVLPVMKKYGKISIDKFGAEFKHPAVGRLLRGVVPETYDASSLLFTLATLHAGDGGYPEGGSLPMVHRMAKTFTDLGGVLLLNSSVKKVNIHNGKTTGVTLENGALDADAVIVTQETIAAVAKLFDTPPNDAWISDLIRETESEVCTFISIGVRTELPDGALPVWELNTPITHAGNTIHSIGFNSYRRYAPEGGTALTTIFGSDTYDFWKKAKSEGRYEEEKHAIAGQVSRALCEKYPQCEGKIEVIDIATPMTYERYTGAYHGSWMSIKRPGSKMKIYPGECENIIGLYFAGHRIMPPGGLPGALATGRTAAQQLCRRFNVMFVSE